MMKMRGIVHRARLIVILSLQVGAEQVALTLVVRSLRHQRGCSTPERSHDHARIGRCIQPLLSGKLRLVR